MRRLLRLTNSQGPAPMRKSIAVRFALETRDQTSQPEANSTTVENQERPNRAGARSCEGNHGIEGQVAG